VHLHCGTNFVIFSTILTWPLSGKFIQTDSLSKLLANTLSLRNMAYIAFAAYNIYLYCTGRTAEYATESDLWSIYKHMRTAMSGSMILFIGFQALCSSHSDAFLAAFVVVSGANLSTIWYIMLDHAGKYSHKCS
jgi:hypothetical protein